MIPDLDRLLSIATDVALDAGRVVREAFGAPLGVRQKRPGDLVSAADLASERLIRDALTRATPDIAFVGEEEGGEHADLGWFVTRSTGPPTSCTASPWWASRWRWWSAASRSDEYLPVFEQALRGFEDLQRAGAASFDLAWTAAGVFDAYFEQALATWDVAAGGLVVREAGGLVTDWRGDERAWLRSGDVIAGPAANHGYLLGLVARAAGTT